jgi:hypothetical protein
MSKMLLLVLTVFFTFGCVTAPDFTNRLYRVKPLKTSEKEYASSASGLALIGDAVYVVADDEMDLYEFHLGPSPSKKYPLLPGSLPTDGKARSHAKPDFESLLKVNIEKASFLLAVPSGSKQARTQGALFNLATKHTSRVDFAPLYHRLKEIYPDLNIEGMVRMKDFFVLFNRGHGSDAPSAMIYLHANKVIGDLKKRVLTADGLSHQVNVKLGAFQKTALHFSDADYVPGENPEDEGTLYVLASAEATNSASDNGKIVGTMFGVITPTGKFKKMGWFPGEKFEGLSVQGGITPDFFIVNDPDDRSIVARLLKFSL